MINKDFQVKVKQERHPALRWVIFAVSSIVLTAVIANTSNETEQEALETVTFALKTKTHTQTTDGIKTMPTPDTDKPKESLARQSFTLPLPEQQTQRRTPDNIQQIDPKKWQEFKVRSGDSLAILFKRAGLTSQQLAEIIESGDAAKKLRQIYPNDIIRVLTNDENMVIALRYEIDHKTYLRVERKNEKLISNILEYDIEVRTNHAYNEIDTSFFLAAQKAGVSQTTIMELANIFGWDIDFALDIRKGDRFTMIYEELYRNGEKIGDGNILTAEFINNKKTYRAARYRNPQTGKEEYFTEDGKSMRKAFLRSPVDFTRISSKFSNSRYHPVLHKFRSHKGVDYAAKRGTPVKASGDGKVIFKGKKGGYGRVLIVQHGSKYTTLYAHLNSYNKKIRKGKKVKQGQTIAYVGSSGLATGPHLHYELRLNGVHRNPLTVSLPSAKPVPKRYMADYQTTTAPVFAKLDLLTRTQLALNE